MKSHVQWIISAHISIKIYVYISAPYYLAATKENCKSGYGLITDVEECKKVAQLLIDNTSEYNGYGVTAIAMGWKEDNEFTTGCYWSTWDGNGPTANGEMKLHINPYGLEAQVANCPAEDCRTLCVGECGLPGPSSGMDSVSE